MKTLEELIYEFGGLSGGTIEKHIYDYFQKLLGDTVASYEIDRINLVDVTLERDELDEQYKIAVRDRNTAREMYKETVQERDGWMTEANELKSKVAELNVYIEELENTLGLRNRSNPDLTIDDEPKSVFDKWKECKD